MCWEGEGLGVFAFPEAEGGEDLLGFSGGREFPGEGHFGFEMAEELVVGERAGEGDAVVALGPLNVVEVRADEVGGHFFEPLVVVEKTEIVLESDVAEVVPVADLGALLEMLLEGDHFALVGDVFVLRAGFDGEDDACFFGWLDESFEGVDGALIIFWAALFTFLDASEFVVGIFSGELESVAEFVGEELGPLFVGHAAHGAHVEDDILGMEF